MIPLSDYDRDQFNTIFVRSSENSIAITVNGKIKYKYLINAAGSYADKIAKQYGVGAKYKLIPFMGTYLELVEEKSSLINSNIYPVPDIQNPFLGIHFTKSINGKVYIGPNAFPVFGRENYSLFEGLSLESLDILLMDVQLFFSNSAFRSNAISEMKKYFTDYLFDEARKLVPSLKKEYIKPSTKKGIRPQLIDIKKRQLVMDFVVEKEANTIHVLNAISPAFTSSMAFAKYICDKID